MVVSMMMGVRLIRRVDVRLDNDDDVVGAVDVRVGVSVGDNVVDDEVVDKVDEVDDEDRRVVAIVDDVVVWRFVS
jgi:hypothetical protein